jgi:hypothetical protein
MVVVGLRFFLRAFGRASLRHGGDEHYATHTALKHGDHLLIGLCTW